MLSAVCAGAILTACSGPAPAPSATPPPQSEAEKAAAKAEAEANITASFLKRADGLTAQLGSLKRSEITSVEQAVATIRLFQEATLLIDGVNEGSASQEVKAANGKLSALLVKKQVQLFPHLRQTYADHMARELGEVAVYVRATGAGGKTFRIASPTFGSKDTVMQAHYGVAGQLTTFRFARAEYVYSIGGANYSFKVNGPTDAAIKY